MSIAHPEKLQQHGGHGWAVLCIVSCGVRYIPSAKKQNYKRQLADEMQIINLSDHILTDDEILILSQPPKYNSFEWTKNINMFIRKDRWAKFVYKRNKRMCNDVGLEMSYLEGIETLKSLYEESNRPVGEGPFTELHNKSTWPAP